jgi:hypothetical protein
MSSATVATVTKMMESLPDQAQDRVAEHICEYIQDLSDELKWDEQFRCSQNCLINAARKVRKQIKRGHAKSMDLEML